MSRLNRAELQLRTRAKVLAAARAEFADRGYRDTTIDRIATRADLTRGAVYSNFPSKRALYFSTLTPSPPSLGDPQPTATGLGDAAVGRSVRHDPALSDLAPGLHGGRTARHATVADGLAAFATAWLEHEHPAPDVLPELADIAPQYAGLLNLNATLLALSLSHLTPAHLDPTRAGHSRPAPNRVEVGQFEPPPEWGQLGEDEGRRLGQLIGVARLALTLLTGATQQLTSAPGVVQPLAIARACAHLADLDAPDRWTPPPTTPPVRPANDPLPDTSPHEALSAPPDGIVAILGLNRLDAAEDIVRTITSRAPSATSPARPTAPAPTSPARSTAPAPTSRSTTLAGTASSAPATTTPVTIALVSSNPDELSPLARYTTSTLFSCLQQALPDPRIHLVYDFDGVLASSLGCDVIGDELEYAALVTTNRIVARAEGFGAARAIAELPQATIRPTPSVTTPTASDAAPTHSTHRN